MPWRCCAPLSFTIGDNSALKSLASGLGFVHPPCWACEIIRFCLVNGLLLELPQGNAFRENVLELLISWRVSMEINNILETEDREVFMTLSQTYQEWKEATKREGRREGKLEGKLESIPRLLALGLSVEQIAQSLFALERTFILGAMALSQ